MKQCIPSEDVRKSLVWAINWLRSGALKIVTQDGQTGTPRRIVDFMSCAVAAMSPLASQEALKVSWASSGISGGERLSRSM